ncbi:MAG: MgtC/SapB family protein [Candidatus Aenigmarchaeota archaeon]|nr:MgtC/SapB family protein [Candidatus Aenigmarchaeota archaeon]
MLEYLQPAQITFLIVTALSVLCGLVIGAERELRSKPAGISTHILICFGGALLTLISQSIEPNTPARVAANIVTGVGFLGAGLILKGKNGYVHGLTSAASIWCTAAIGLAIGFGWYFEAVVSALVATLVPRIPHIRGTKSRGK